VHKTFPQETLSLYEFRTGTKKEYFVECESHESTLLAYYTLNSIGEKTNFKNPLHLDRMSEQEKKERLELRWRRKPAGEHIE
jgi:hypothetical protein